MPRDATRRVMVFKGSMIFFVMEEAETIAAATIKTTSRIRMFLAWNISL